MDRLDDLLEEWEERRDAGRPATPEELCPDDPVLRAGLASAIRQLQRFEAVVAGGPAAADAAAAAPPPRPRSLAAPVRIGKYGDCKYLDGGGYGDVYDGFHPGLKCRVAIKVLRPARQAAVARFVQEGEVLAKLNHPGIVRVYDCDIDHDPPYLVMEFVPGGTLARANRRGELTAAGPRAVVPLVEKVARAVAAAHAKKVVHRDLKPGNVLLDGAGEPKVADFGLARLFAADPGPNPPAAGRPGDPDADTELASAGLTAPGGRAGGTPPYMAPEQFDPAFGEVGPATDVWALGVILFELLTGDRPFPGPKYPDHHRQVTAGPAPPLKGFGGRLAAVVARCLEKDPARRFRSAGELADALGAVNARRRRVRQAGWLLAAVACAVLAGGLVGGAVWRETRPERVYERGVAPHLKAIAAGRAVDLIPTDGRVPPHLVRTTAADAVVTAGPDGLVIDSARPTLVEFLPHVPAGDYTLIARLRHDHSLHHNAPSAGVGLVTSGFHHDGPAGRQHLYRAASFSARHPDGGLHTGVTVQWYLERPDGTPGRKWYAIPYTSGRLEVGPADPTTVWVTVEVAVTAGETDERIVFGSDQAAANPVVCPGTAYRAFRDVLVRDAPEAAGVPLPERTPRSVGVIVYGGRCTVAQVTVRPR